MKFHEILLAILLCCILADGKKVKVADTEYTVLPYNEDCTKYVLCNAGKCQLMSCHFTYVFDPATSTCTHRTRGYTDCDRRHPRKSRF